MYFYSPNENTVGSAHSTKLGVRVSTSFVERGEKLLGAHPYQHVDLRLDYLFLAAVESFLLIPKVIGKFLLFSHARRLFTRNPQERYFWAHRSVCLLVYVR